MSIYLDEAISIGDRVASAAFRHRDMANWVARKPAVAAVTPAHERPALRSLSFELYGGTSGIALFLARLHAFSHSPLHRDVALAAMRHALRHARASLGVVPPTRLGVYGGALGVAWAAWEAADLLGEDGLRRQAARIFAELRPTAHRAHERDLLSGSSGAILALLSLEERSCEGAAGIAARLGDGLVRSARKRDGAWSWAPRRSAGRTSAHLLGLAHGASGMALALAALHGATRHEVYREGALGALRYERERFDDEHRNWPDLGRADREGAASRVAWCHGAAGVGLARVLLHPVLSDDALLKEAEVALGTTLDQLRFEIDHPGREVTLCHGLLGTTECAAMVDAALGGRHAADIAAVSKLAIERWGGDARATWGDTTGYPTAVPAGRLEPSLFHGEAGIGHHFLRLHDSTRVPTILVPGRMMR